MSPKEFLKGKKVVVMGLGVFGGGVASAKFCVKHGASVTVTDLRDATALAGSLKSFTAKEKAGITFVLGEHRESDFKNADTIIVNPGVPNTSPYLKIAGDHSATLENDTSLFFRFSTIPTIAVTGTRGKTTTTNWIAQLLSYAYGPIKPIGNSSNNPLLNELSKEKTCEVQPRTLKKPHVAELSSWQLELLPQSSRAPHIAVITNIYPDHLNRYNSIEDYAAAKVNIFKHQTKDDFLILNYDNPWRNFFMDKERHAQTYFFSTKKLPKKVNGIFFSGSGAIFQKNGIQKKMVLLKDFEKRWGRHNLENILAAILAVHLFDPKLRISQKMLGLLTEIPFRQQTTYKDKHLRIINDSTSTSPDALISAVNRFKGADTVYIAGGTSKNLPFNRAAQSLKKNVPAKNLILLSGSATNDLIFALEKADYPIKNTRTFDTLQECVNSALAQKVSGTKTIVFSPGAASFEKFKNEFDRGNQFSIIVQNAPRNKMSR